MRGTKKILVQIKTRNPQKTHIAVKKKEKKKKKKMEKEKRKS